MTIYGSLLPGARSIAHWASKVTRLSNREQQRVKILDWHRAHGTNVSITARHFGLTRYTVRQWNKRFKERGMYGLRDQSHRPRHLRQPTTSWQIVERIVVIRREYPAWSKYKIQELLRREGVTLGASTIGRILKRKGLINARVSQRKKRAAHHPRARFPRGLKISRPGLLALLFSINFSITSRFSLLAYSSNSAS